MANYCGFTRTNYFSVTDEAKFRDIIGKCVAEDSVEIFKSDSEDGKFAFGCYSGIQEEISCGAYDDCYDCPKSETAECETPGLYEMLQSVVASDDAIIITEVGHEKLRYLVGVSIIITKDSIRAVSLDIASRDIAREMLANPDFNTVMVH